jgi:predicted flap endonuclease-1-like 5' DNA nuclease
MSSLRRAMSELAARDLQLTRAAVRLEERGDAAARSPAPAAAPAGLGTFEANAPAVADAPTHAAPATADALEEIIGIGPTIARRLRLAGIKTYKQIAESTPDQLEEIARLPDWRKSNFKAWIEQARKLAGDG